MAPPRLAIALVLTLGLGACAAEGPRPAGMLGYGTPDVSAYAEGGTSLQAQLAACRGVAAATPGVTQGLSASCDQLRRMASNQPGNAVQASSGP